MLQDEINILNLQIQENQTELNKGIENFRLRLRALYIAGNDSYASDRKSVV